MPAQTGNLNTFIIEANSMNCDQTAPKEAKPV